MTIRPAVRCPVCHAQAPLTGSRVGPHVRGSQPCSGAGRSALRTAPALLRRLREHQPDLTDGGDLACGAPWPAAVEDGMPPEWKLARCERTRDHGGDVHVCIDPRYEDDEPLGWWALIQWPIRDDVEDS